MDDATARGAVDAYWASALGCSPTELSGPSAARTTVVASDMARYRGAHALRRGAVCVVSVPPPWLETARRALGGRDPAEVFDPAALATAFGDAVERIVGPAYVGYASAGVRLPTGWPGVRLLATADGGDDGPALERLRAACPPEEWDHSGVDASQPPVFGAFDGAALVAAGKLQDLDGTLLHVGVVTHPAHRRRGHGRRVVEAMTAHALRAGRVPQYRTLTANAPAVAIARALGYREYGTTLAVRLAMWAPAFEGGARAGSAR